jgi:hypothetical protein
MDSRINARMSSIESRMSSIESDVKYLRDNVLVVDDFSLSKLLSNDRIEANRVLHEGLDVTKRHD